ncbi:glycosyltransferase family 2 protein [Leptospirillum ferriphilum]|uniref:Putative glycosyl transferase, family 2 n=1 Tax=Leptospirillum ferriphilum (strain ML-04) TaxID=1048260 RepID=J9ZAA9_LEPFM|nr:glycosyltransferase family A protein [Leptospirillum ferriphilum]AFS53465.1 putative glycosyl transferase, family 2 [Leptospirillum ferriphilum ML-04]
MKPTISVIIPFTKNPIQLDEAISSVMQQTFKDFEIVLVNNQSSQDALDNALVWSRKHPAKIRLVSELKKGAAAARNRGILESHGEFIAFLDSDDRMKPHRLYAQLEALKNHPEITLVGAWKDRVSPDGQTLLEKNDKPKIPRWASILFLDDSRFLKDPLFEPQTSTFFFRKETALEIGSFDETFDPFWLEDTDFVLRMYQRGRILIVPDSLIEYRTHTQEEEDYRIFDIRNIQNHGLFFEKLKGWYFSKSSPSMRKAFDKIASRWLRESAIKIIYFHGGEKISRVLLKRAIAANNLDIKNIECFLRFFLPSSLWPRPFNRIPLTRGVLPEDINLEWAKSFLSI